MNAGNSEEKAMEEQSRVGDWELCYDKDGTPYYYNVKTEETAWELPRKFRSQSSRAKKQEVKNK